jgi:hypothetical protein
LARRTIWVPGVYDMRVNNPIFFYFLFKTMAPDGSAFFGIHRSTNISWGTDGNPVKYIGNGPKLQAKVKQFGINAMRLEVLSVDGDYATIRKRLEAILTPATLADPRCLNMPLPVRNVKISEAMRDQSKSPEHREAIALAMVGNQNAAKVSDDIEVGADDDNGMVWYHNPATSEELQLEHDEEPLTGFVKGKLPVALKGKFVKGRKKVLSDAERAQFIKD